jgi:hypothetical protein
MLLGERSYYISSIEEYFVWTTVETELVHEDYHEAIVTLCLFIAQITQ